MADTIQSISEELYDWMAEAVNYIPKQDRPGVIARLKEIKSFLSAPTAAPAQRETEIRLGDEITGTGVSANIAAASKSPAIAPAQVWRLLEAGEVIQVGDEAYDEIRHEWFKCVNTVGDTYSVEKHNLIHRRRVALAAPDGVVEALEFYADKENWATKWTVIDGIKTRQGEFLDSVVLKVSGENGYDRARAALAAARVQETK